MEPPVCANQSHAHIHVEGVAKGGAPASLGLGGQSYPFFFSFSSSVGMWGVMA